MDTDGHEVGAGLWGRPQRAQEARKARVLEEKCARWALGEGHG